MFNLIVVILSSILVLLVIQLFTKWKINQITKKTILLESVAHEKDNRFRRIEELACNKLQTMTYSEQITKFISDGVVIATKEYILFANPAMSKITGYSNKELTMSSWKDFIFEEDLEDVEQTIATNFTNQIHVDGSVHYVNRWKHKNGKIITLWWTITPFDENDICYAICRDVTRYNGKKENVKILLNKLLGNEYNGNKKNITIKSLPNGHDKKVTIKRASNE